MNIVSFGGHVHQNEVPRLRNTNSQAQQTVSEIIKALEKVPEGQALPIKVTDFGKYERYAMQTRLQKRGAKVQLTVTGERDKEGDIKSGTLYVVKMTADQWKTYCAKPGATAGKK
jgi:hypothetical protein